MSRDSHLRPFTANQVRELLATSDVKLPVAQHDKVVDLCDTPFVALELAAHDEIEGAHTEALRHAFLGPVDELPDDAPFALHVAAVLGEYTAYPPLPARSRTCRPARWACPAPPRGTARRPVGQVGPAVPHLSAADSIRVDDLEQSVFEQWAGLHDGGYLP